MTLMGWVFIAVGVIVLLVGVCFGVKVVHQTERGLVERFGRYIRFANPGFHWVIPFIENIRLVNVTEQMVEAEKREIITKDKLNAQVAAQVYFRVQPVEASTKASQYEVDDYETQIVALAKTTLRNIIGTMTLTEANSDRIKINSELAAHLSKETNRWGIEIVRTELKEIDPPKDVQESMNNVVKAENEKVAAKDFAIAKETEADGQRMAAVKIADGHREADILMARGKAEAIVLVNDAATKSFKEASIRLRELEVIERGLVAGSKIIIVPSGESLGKLLTSVVAGGV